MWKLGEWWVYGEINYGEKTSMTKSDDWDGPSYQTCADAGWVFKKLQFSRRHENLSWSHHREVAGLDEEDADRFLNDAIVHKWSRKQLRKQVSDFNGANMESIIFTLDEPPQTEPPPTKPLSGSAPSPSSEPSSSRASNFRSETSTVSVPNPSEPSHGSAPSTESERCSESLAIPTNASEINPSKPIVSPEAMNASLRADLNRYKEAAESLQKRLNEAEQKLTENDGIINRQGQELYEARNTIDSQNNTMAIQVSTIIQLEEENESLRKEIYKLRTYL
jgi:hypothetical protein